MNTKTRNQAKAALVNPFIPARAGILRRKCFCGVTPGPTGQCATCQRQPLARHGLPTWQTKLKINEPGDKYEREADRIADQVMRMQKPQLQQQN